MVLYDLLRALGAGKKLAVGSASVANGGTIDTGLKSIEAFVLMSSGSGHIATGTASGGTITVSLVNHDGSNVTSAETVYYIAVGE